MPISAIITTEEIFQPFMYPNPFLQTTTTGGGALACSAAIAAIHVTLRDRLWEAAAEKGDYIKRQVTELGKRYPNIYRDVTGKGLLIGLHFDRARVGFEVTRGLFKRGVLTAGAGAALRAIRIEPPLVIEYQEIDEGLNRLEDTLKSVSLTVWLPDILGQAQRWLRKRTLRS